MTIGPGGSLLDRLKSEAHRAGLALVAAQAVATLTRDHLIALDGKRHRHGRHYYLQAAGNVTVQTNAAGLASVTIDHVGIRQRRYGGPIVPKAGKKYLTLPAQPKAYGKSAREFGDLAFGLALDERGALRPALVRRASTATTLSRRKRKDGSLSVAVNREDLQRGQVMFWLRRRVNQGADPSVLPADTEAEATALHAIRRHLVQLDPNAGGGAHP
ncbi:MAG: hypothetical protein V4773_04875 [Verrucomicrobiota bacterium]